MQTINKILFDSNNWTQFFWLNYLPNWISPFWFYLFIWCLILFLGIDWKKNLKVTKKVKSKFIWNEDMYFFFFATFIYSILILQLYGIFNIITIIVIWIFGELIAYFEFLTNYLLEDNEELDNRFSIWHKITVIWKEFLAYWKK